MAQFKGTEIIPGENKNGFLHESVSHEFQGN